MEVYIPFRFSGDCCNIWNCKYLLNPDIPYSQGYWNTESKLVGPTDMCTICSYGGCIWGRRHSQLQLQLPRLMKLTVQELLQPQPQITVKRKNLIMQNTCNAVRS